MFPMMSATEHHDVIWCENNIIIFMQPTASFYRFVFAMTSEIYQNAKMILKCEIYGQNVKYIVYGGH